MVTKRVSKREKYIFMFFDKKTDIKYKFTCNYFLYQIIIRLIVYTGK